MKVVLKKISEFANWSLAFQFLNRSPIHFLLTDELPKQKLCKAHRSQIILHGIHDPEDQLLSVPAHYAEGRIKAICGGLIEHAISKFDPDTFIGSVKSSNFVSFLQEFSEMLQGRVRLDEVSKAIIQKTKELFDAEGATILVPNKEMTAFHFAYHEMSKEEVANALLQQQEMPANRGVAGWVARNRKPILVNESNNTQISDRVLDEQFNIKTKEIIAAPISIGGRLLGVLEVFNPNGDSFEDSDLQTLELIASIIMVFIEKAEAYEAQMNYALVQKELDIAHQLQSRIMPSLPSQFGPFHLMGESHQFAKVGGDFWDIFHCSDTEKVLIIGDVSGHGLSAALMMTAVRSACRALLQQVQTPFALIEPLNYLIHRENQEVGHYVTMIICHFDLAVRKVKYFRAGHEKPILRRNGEFQLLDHPGGLPIGILPKRLNDPWAEIDLQPGDQLYFYTDGIIDGLPVEEDKDDEGITLDHFLSSNLSLVNHLESQNFFDVLVEEHQWTHRDDATILELTLEEHA